MQVLLAHGLGTPLTLVLFLWCVLGRNAFPALGRALGALASPGGGRLVLCLILVVAGVDFLQSPFDPYFSRWLGYDFTPWVREVEGDWIERVQATLPRALVPLMAWAYLSGWLATLILPAVVYTELGELRTLAGYLLGFVANYAFALPFYLFFPVTEVAWSGLSSSRPLIDDVLPGISEQMRPGSALDNCFPSLHVAMVVNALWFAQRCGPPRMRWIVWVLAVLVTYSVMALGIHWGLDSAFGVVFGLCCGWVGECSAARLWPWIRSRTMVPVEST